MSILWGKGKHYAMWRSSAGNFYKNKKGQGKPPFDGGAAFFYGKRSIVTKRTYNLLYHSQVVESKKILLLSEL
jgi:hypothetical protein